MTPQNLAILILNVALIRSQPTDPDFYIPTATFTVVKGFLIGIILSLFITGLTITFMIFLTGIFKTNQEFDDFGINEEKELFSILKSTFARGKMTIYRRFASFKNPGMKYNLRTGFVTVNNRHCEYLTEPHNFNLSSSHKKIIFKSIKSPNCYEHRWSESSLV